MFAAAPPAASDFIAPADSLPADANSTDSTAGGANAAAAASTSAAAAASSVRSAAAATASSNSSSHAARAEQQKRACDPELTPEARHAQWAHLYANTSDASPSREDVRAVLATVLQDLNPAIYRIPFVPSSLIDLIADYVALPSTSALPRFVVWCDFDHCHGSLVDSVGLHSDWDRESRFPVGLVAEAGAAAAAPAAAGRQDDEFASIEQMASKLWNELSQEQQQQVHPNKPAEADYAAAYLVWRKGRSTALARALVDTRAELEEDKQEERRPSSSPSSSPRRFSYPLLVPVVESADGQHLLRCLDERSILFASGPIAVLESLYITITEQIHMTSAIYVVEIHPATGAPLIHEAARFIRRHRSHIKQLTDEDRRRACRNPPPFGLRTEYLSDNRPRYE